MKILDNISNTVCDDLRAEIKRGSRVSVAAACFSMYVYQELKVGLKKLKQVLGNSQDKGTERGRKVAYSEYRDLTPIDSIENGDEYIKALNWAFQNKKVRNIALTGPYSSGKSSIIETFLRKDEESKVLYKIFLHKIIIKITLKMSMVLYKAFLHKYTIRGSALKISMATFRKGDYGKEESASNEKIKVDADEIERGILKQLFYKVDPKRIPQSRYRKLHQISFFRVLFFSTVGLVLIGIFAAIFAPSIYGDFLGDAIRNFISPVTSDPFYTLMVAVILLGVCSLVITYLYCTVISKIKMKEIKFLSDITIQNSSEETDSVFNRNLDEIIYFFEATDYRTVFFEDLDRLDDPKIFVHLRELNNLLNNDDAIKKKPIVFVYAVRDDIFSEEDRTKFFDFIIPVIPVINSTNSGEILLQRLQEAKKNGVEHEISQEFVLDIAPFISDMRILQNIYNEFIVYKEILRTSQELSLSDEQMLAMIVFKNLYPSDFADIQDEKGVLKKAFTDKSDFIAKKRRDIQEKIDKDSTIIDRAQKDVLKSIRELKYALLGSLMDGLYIFKGFGKGNSSAVQASEFMHDDYDMTKIIQNRYENIYYRDYNNNYYSNCIEVNKEVNKEVLSAFIGRWENIKEVGEKGLQKLQKDLEERRERQHKLSGMSLVRLIETYSTGEVFSAEVQKNELLVFLLRRGYIDEKYANYINYFKGTSLTKADMNFILSVKSQSPLNFDYQLTKTPMVINRLQEYEFEQKAIYNFNLLEQMLLGNISEKLKTFIGQLADGNEASWQFIDEFVDKTEKQALFIRLLAEKWHGMWAYISTDEKLTYDHQLFYLQIMLSESEITTIEAQNTEGCLTRYFEEHDDILQKLESCDAYKIISVIDKLNVRFKTLQIEGVSHEVLDNVFDKCHYMLNETMIKTVVAYRSDNLISTWEEKPYSTLITLADTPLMQYVHDHIVIFVDEIVLTHSNLSDRPEDIVDMLIRLEGEQDLQTRLIKQESFHLDSIEECACEQVHAEKDNWITVWNALLEKGAVTVSWKNVLDYWKVYQVSDELKEYISHHAEELSGMDTASVEDDFIKAFINANFKIEVKQKLLPVLKLNDFDLDITSLDEFTLRIMIACNYFEFTVERYSVISSISPDIATDFILKNQDEYMELKENIPMSGNLLERLLFSKCFSVKNKNQLFTEYAENYMTEKIAEQMKELNMPVTKYIFNIAWGCIGEKKREGLLLDNCTLFDADELERYFGELGGPYAELADRTRRHDVNLPVTDRNKALATHLRKLEYITSDDEKDEKFFDDASGCEKTRKVLKMRIKQVK
ncbi:YobI family P-loop NTPase [Dialister invisus]|uniref:YobI family P-loop NTPase n=1 Tax=Dialister invisus TaxID=218538 RepID=UPI00265ADF75|nr:hypothetical protein [Dialister invisus]